MSICAILVGIGITVLCPDPPPPPPDLAAIELRDMREEMKRDEQRADEKLDWFYGKRRSTENANR
jgi:hypothetical protein